MPQKMTARCRARQQELAGYLYLYILRSETPWPLTSPCSQQEIRSSVSEEAKQEDQESGMPGVVESSSRANCGTTWASSSPALTPLSERSVNPPGPTPLCLDK